MGLFDKLLKKPDTHQHRRAEIPELLNYKGKTHIRKYFYWDVPIDVTTKYPYLKDGDQIMFRDEGGKIHAYFDDEIDVGTISRKGIIDMIFDFVNRGGFYVANINPNSNMLRIGFYDNPDTSGKTPTKMTVAITRSDFFSEVGDRVDLEYDDYEVRYLIGDSLQSIKLSEAQSQKIRNHINEGYNSIDAVVVEKEITDNLKNKVKVEISFK